MLYVKLVWFAQIVPGPEMVAGELGAVVVGFTGKVAVGLLPQEFPAETETRPAAAPGVTVIVVVPCPAVMVQPAGTVQLYVVAPATGEIEYVVEALPTHGTLFPVIAPGAGGALGEGVKPKMVAVLVPQPLEAVTVIGPAYTPT